MRYFLLLAVCACTEFTIHKPPDLLAGDSDSDLPADTDIVETEQETEDPEETETPPIETDDTDVPVETDDTDIPVDTAPPPVPPVADAGNDRIIAPLVTVNLNGSASYDPMGRPIDVFRWTWVNKPAGSSAVVLLPSWERPTFFADVAGTYELMLEVRSKAGLWDPTPDTVVIEVIPDKRFYVQLTWNAASDLDLHVIKDGSSVFERRWDCNFCNKHPSWYTSIVADDPSLDIDDIDGNGPETTTIKEPAPAALFHVQVHYYGEGGNPSCTGSCPASRATLDFYIDGVLVHTLQRVLHQDDDLWDAATVDWATLTITDVDVMTSTPLTSCP